MPTQIAKLLESIDTVWAKLVSRAVRVALARRDMSYAQLAAELAHLGISESARSVEGKVQRGTFRFTFFLQALTASHVDCPSGWLDIMEAPGTWEERASAILRVALAPQPWLSWPQLAQRLAEIGITLDSDVLATQAKDGSFSAALFFQCAAVCQFQGVQLFLDLSSLRNAAVAGKPAS
jgi:hypothetical protein